MNISPVSNTSFNGMFNLNLPNSNRDRVKICVLDGSSDMYIRSASKVIPGRGNLTAPIAFSESEDDFGNDYLTINSDYVTEISPERIRVENPDKMMFANVDLSDLDYRAVLNAYNISKKS